jgi:hypothetical protein
MTLPPPTPPTAEPPVPMPPRDPLPAWLCGPLEALLQTCLRAHGERLDGRRHGLWTRRLPNGRRLTETHYVHGQRHGTDTRWYLSGRKQYVGEWLEGRKTGEWFYFRRNGKLDGPRTGKYENGLRFSALKGFNDWNA